MDKTMSTAPVSDRIHVDYLIGMLDVYCGRALTYPDDENMLWGSALAMRKATELIGAYLLTHDETGSFTGEEMPVAEGDTVRRRLNQGKKTRADVKAYVEALNDTVNGENGLNQILHYQAYRVLQTASSKISDADREALLDGQERQLLCGGHSVIRSALPFFCRAVCVFCDGHPEVAACIAGHTQLARVIGIGECVIRHADMSGGILYKRELADIVGDIRAYYESDADAAADPWIAWMCSVLSSLQQLAPCDCGAAEAMYIMLRVICERTLVRRICRLNKYAGKGSMPGRNLETADSTIESYIQALGEIANKQAECDPEGCAMSRDIIQFAKCAQSEFNGSVHWRCTERYDGVSQPRRAAHEQSVTRRLNLGSQIVSYSVQDDKPVYAWTWVDRNRGSLEAWRAWLKDMKADAERAHAERDEAERERREVLSLAVKVIQKADETERELVQTRQKAKRERKLTIAAVMIAAVMIACAAVTVWQRQLNTAPQPEWITLSTGIGGMVLTPEREFAVRGGETVSVEAVSDQVNVNAIRCSFDGGEEQDALAGDVVVPYGQEGDTFVLWVVASGRTTDDSAVMKRVCKEYTLRYEDAAAPPDALTADDVFMRANVSLGGMTLRMDERIFVRPGDKLEISADTNAPAVRLGAYYVKDGTAGDIASVSAGEMVFTCPENERGRDIHLYIEAEQDTDGDAAARSGWQHYVLCYDEAITRAAPAVVLEKWTLEDRSVHPAWPGMTARIVGVKGGGSRQIRYRWDEEPWSIAQDTEQELKIPDAFAEGEIHWLHTEMLDETGGLISGASYGMEIAARKQVSMDIACRGMILQDGMTLQVEPGDVITARAYSESGIWSVGCYYYVDGEKTPIYDSMEDSLEIVCPQAEPGSERDLYIEAVGRDNLGISDDFTQTGWQCIHLRYK